MPLAFFQFEPRYSKLTPTRIVRSARLLAPLNLQCNAVKYEIDNLWSKGLVAIAGSIGNVTFGD